MSFTAKSVLMAACVLAGLLALTPALVVFYGAVAVDHQASGFSMWNVISQPGYRGVVFNTFRIAFFSAVLAVAFGALIGEAVCAAPALEQSTLLLAGCAATYAMLSVMKALGFILLFAQDSFLARALHSFLGLGASSLTSSRFGLIVAITHMFLPAAILAFVKVRRSVPVNQIRAARLLGANGWRVFRAVVIPAVTPTLYALFSAFFLISLGIFVTPSMLGGTRGVMMSNLIADELNTVGGLDRASALSAFFALLVFLCAITASTVPRLITTVVRSRTKRAEHCAH